MTQATNSSFLSDRVCIVTGAASGIGRAIAVAYADHGAAVILADVTEQPIEGGPSTRSLIDSRGGNALFVRTDVSRFEDVDQLIATTVQRFGRLDVMVNNACIRHAKPLLELEEEQWQRIMEVNLSGVYRCCKAAVRQMVTQAVIDEVRGRIINLSSQHGMIAAPGDLAYGVAKAGVAYLTRQVAVDYACEGIVCNAIAPGKIQTGQGGRAMDPEVLERAHRRTPWPRLGIPSDVAQAALFLADPRTQFVTGINLLVDGGWMAA